MNHIVFSLICGVGFGSLAVLLMLPVSFHDKRTALSGAFCSRFAIGFLIPLVTLPIPSLATGALVGFLISLPDSIVTKSYGPIIGIGVLGGAFIGWLANAV
jgi:hypothetical protein